MNWTEEEFKAYQEKCKASWAKPVELPPRVLKEKKFAPAFRKNSKGMNKLETKYAMMVLEPMKRTGQILDYFFEPFNLRLADNTYYRPDFLVIFPDRLEIAEVKGHWEDDARAKWKIAAEMFWMFQFVAIQSKKGEWIFERYIKDR